MNLIVFLAFLSWTYAAGNPFFGPKNYVRELTATNFRDRVLYSGNTTAVVFYAPWCGYCKQLAPEWAKTAKNLAGVAQVAAVNCDAEVNKPLCAKYQVQGFPTIKVVKPAKLIGKDFETAEKSGKIPKRRPQTFSYSGARESDPITKFVLNNLVSYVSNVPLKQAAKLLKNSTDPLVVLVTGTKAKNLPVSALFKALSREYFGKLRFVSLSPDAKTAIEFLNIKARPQNQLVYLNREHEPVLFAGETKKKAIKQFLDQQFLKDQKRSESARSQSLESAHRTATTTQASAQTTTEPAVVDDNFDDFDFELTNEFSSDQQGENAELNENAKLNDEQLAHDLANGTNATNIVTNTSAPLKNTADPLGIAKFDDLALRCLRTTNSCAIVVTTNTSNTTDFHALLAALQSVKVPEKTSLYLDYLVPDNHHQLSMFLEDVKFTSEHGMIYWDADQQKAGFYQQELDALHLQPYLQAAVNGSIELHTLPAKYRNWMSEDEVRREVEMGAEDAEEYKLEL